MDDTFESGVYSASDTRTIKARGTTDTDTYSYDSTYRGEGRNDISATYDEETYTGRSHGTRTYDDRRRRKEDLTLLAKRSLIQNGGAWSRMLKGDLDEEMGEGREMG